MLTDTRATNRIWLQRLCIGIFLLVILQNLLPPNGFSGTVLVFDYEFGLIRRGLIGELANFYWSENVSASEVLAVSAAVSLFGLLALLGVIVKKLFGGLIGLWLSLLLVSSFAFKAIVGFTGYMDMILIGVVSLAMLTDPKRLFGIGSRALAVFVGMFCHEIMLPYFAVFLCVDLWLRRGYQMQMREIALASVPMIAGVVAFLILNVLGHVSVEDVPLIVEHINQKVAFATDVEATNIIGRSMGDNLALMAEKRQEAAYTLWVILDGVPLAIMMVWLVWVNLKVMSQTFSGFAQLMVVCAILAPQSLNIIAFDVVRFGALSVLVGFLTLVSLIAAEPNTEMRLQKVITFPVFLTVLLLNQQFMVAQINTGAAHLYELPWVLLEQLNWF